MPTDPTHEFSSAGVPDLVPPFLRPAYAAARYCVMTAHYIRAEVTQQVTPIMPHVVFLVNELIDHFPPAAREIESKSAELSRSRYGPVRYSRWADASAHRIAGLIAGSTLDIVHLAVTGNLLGELHHVTLTQIETQLGRIAERLKQDGGALEDYEVLLAEMKWEASRAIENRPGPTSQVKGKPGRRGYPLKALKHARKIRRKNPGWKATQIRSQCLRDGIHEDHMPPDAESFRRWLNRERTAK